MMHYTESYIDKPYHSKSSIATYLLCGAMLSSGGVAALQDGPVDNTTEQSNYSIHPQPSQILKKHYQTPPTWSSLENISSTKITKETDSRIDVSLALKVVNQLAFMKVDEDVDQKIESYFASKPIKTRTVFENHRIKNG